MLTDNKRLSKKSFGVALASILSLTTTAAHAEPAAATKTNAGTKGTSSSKPNAASSTKAKVTPLKSKKATSKGTTSKVPASKDSGKVYQIKIKVLSAKEQEALLEERLSGDTVGAFGPFCNMFFVRSKIDTSKAIGLMCKIPGAESVDLEPAFASNYKPTLRELLDTLAAQLKARWVYADRSQVMDSTMPPDGKSITDIAIFDFVPAESKFDCEMTPIDGWKVSPQSNFVMYVPPIAPMAMDMHVLGKVSASDPTKQAKLIADTPRDFALDQFRRFKPQAKAEDLKKTKVGSYDAYFFETALPPSGEEKVHWRQWHFMVGNQLYYVISTIIPSQEKQLYPAVEQMIKTFREKERTLKPSL